MSGHTKGPWLLSNDIPPRVYSIKSDGDEPMIACVDDSTNASLDVLEATANAARIVACVNACEGLDTEAIAIADTFAEIMRGTDALRADNARLRNTLGSIACGNVMTGEFTHAEALAKYQELARAALAKVDS